jgi:ATP-dependent DNA helicase RecG
MTEQTNASSKAPRGGANELDRKFMELAINEMHKSRSEHTQKSDPMVGAVLVAVNGQQLGAAHRGDLRVGDHAEFTLIERYCSQTNLEGATLYVTLEPCIKRAEKKTPCAERIKNARIGRVVVGMMDPNPDISGQGVQSLLDNGIDVAFFDVDLVAKIKEANASFVEYWINYQRPETPQEQFEGASTTELEVLPHVDLEGLSWGSLSYYLEHRKIKVRPGSTELWALLKNLRYIGETDQKRLAPTIAGMVLFGSEPAEILPQCRISIEANRGNKSVQSEFRGPLTNFRDHLDAFFKKEMRYFTEIHGLDRIQEPEYPIVAIREAAFNAVMHRNYHGGARVHITLTDNAIVVRSPGALLKPVSLAALRDFNAPQYSRNPHIAVALYHLGWVEEKGSGLRRMRDAMVESGLPAPTFTYDAGYLVATLLGNPNLKKKIQFSPDQLVDLSVYELKIIEIISRKGPVTARNIASALRVDLTTARRYLRRLGSKGLVERSGTGPNVMYSFVRRG